MTLLIYLLLLLPLSAWSAWVITVWWGWFIVPFGAPPIGVWYAAGLAIGTMWFVRIDADDDTPAKERYAHTIAVGLLKPAVILALSFIYHALATT